MEESNSVENSLTALQNAVLGLDLYCVEEQLSKDAMRRLRRIIGTLEQIRSEQEEKAQVD